MISEQGTTESVPRGQLIYQIAIFNVRMILQKVFKPN